MAALALGALRNGGWRASRPRGGVGGAECKLVDVGRSRTWSRTTLAPEREGAGGAAAEAALGNTDRLPRGRGLRGGTVPSTPGPTRVWGVAADAGPRSARQHAGGDCLGLALLTGAPRRDSREEARPSPGSPSSVAGRRASISPGCSSSAHLASRSAPTLPTLSSSALHRLAPLIWARAEAVVEPGRAARHADHPSLRHPHLALCLQPAPAVQQAGRRDGRPGAEPGQEIPARAAPGGARACTRPGPRSRAGYGRPYDDGAA